MCPSISGSPRNPDDTPGVIEVRNPFRGKIDAIVEGRGRVVIALVKSTEVSIATL